MDKKTFLRFKNNEQFSLSNKGDGEIIVYGEISQKSLDEFVKSHLCDILEIIDKHKSLL